MAGNKEEHCLNHLKKAIYVRDVREKRKKLG